MPIKQLPVGSIRDLLNLVSSPSPTFVHLTVISRAEPMLLGIGIDILSLSRLEGLIGRRGGDALARRICCPRELEEFRGKPERTIKDEVRFLSTRWALKEAVYKSLSPNHLPFKSTWKSLEIRYHSTGAPSLHLVHQNDRAEGKSAGVDFMASLSGDAGVVVGVVVALRKG